MKSYDTRHPALQDKRVRQALNLAIDRDLLIKAVFNGMSTVPNGFQMKSFGDMYIADHKGAQFDPDKARMLLKEAGYKGEEISFRYLKDYYAGEVSTVQILEQELLVTHLQLFRGAREFGQLLPPCGGHVAVHRPARVDGSLGGHAARRLYFAGLCQVNRPAGRARYGIPSNVAIVPVAAPE